MAICNVYFEEIKRTIRQGVTNIHSKFSTDNAFIFITRRVERILNTLFVCLFFKVFIVAYASTTPGASGSMVFSGTSNSYSYKEPG